MTVSSPDPECVEVRLQVFLVPLPHLGGLRDNHEDTGEPGSDPKMPDISELD